MPSGNGRRGPAGQREPGDAEMPVAAVVWPDEAEPRLRAQWAFATSSWDQGASRRGAGDHQRRYRAARRSARPWSQRGANWETTGARRPWGSPELEPHHWPRAPKAAWRVVARRGSRRGPGGRCSGRTWRDRSPESRPRAARSRIRSSRGPHHEANEPLAKLAATGWPRRPTVRAALPSGCWMRPRRTNAFLT